MNRFEYYPDKKQIYKFKGYLIFVVLISILSQKYDQMLFFTSLTLILIVLFMKNEPKKLEIIIFQDSIILPRKNFLRSIGTKTIEMQSIHKIVEKTFFSRHYLYLYSQKKEIIVSDFLTASDYLELKLHLQNFKPIETNNKDSAKVLIISIIFLQLGLVVYLLQSKLNINSMLALKVGSVTGLIVVIANLLFFKLITNYFFVQRKKDPG